MAALPAQAPPSVSHSALPRVLGSAPPSAALQPFWRVLVLKSPERGGWLGGYSMFWGSGVNLKGSKSWGGHLISEK